MPPPEPVSAPATRIPQQQSLARWKRSVAPVATFSCAPPVQPIAAGVVSVPVLTSTVWPLPFQLPSNVAVPVPADLRSVAFCAKAPLSVWVSA